MAENDLVQRLREHAKHKEGEGWTEPLCYEAADEIERLRTLTMQANDLTRISRADNERLKTELENLRADRDEDIDGLINEHCDDLSKISQLRVENQRLKEELEWLELRMRSEVTS